MPKTVLSTLRCRQASWGHDAPETLYKYVHASDDGGRTWQHVGLPGPIQWPQIFTCASGVVQRAVPCTLNLSCTMPPLMQKPVSAVLPALFKHANH